MVAIVKKLQREDLVVLCQRKGNLLIYGTVRLTGILFVIAYRRLSSVSGFKLQTDKIADSCNCTY